jgi:hypothetical protein
MGGVAIYILVFFTTALDGSECSNSRPVRFIPKEFDSSHLRMPSSGMRRLVVFVRSNISEEYIAFIIRVKGILEIT